MEEEDQEILGAYLVKEVLGHRDGQTFLNKLNDHGYYTLFDIISITGEDIESMGCFLRADKHLWEIFINYITTQVRENKTDFRILSCHEDFLKQIISREGFMDFRLRNITSKTETVDTGKFILESPSVFTPVPRNLSGNVTTRTTNQPTWNSSVGTMSSPVTIRSTQTINPSTKKTQKVTDFPIFSGQMSDWKLFERKFLAIANSQNYGHVLELDPPFLPTPEQEDEFKSDLKYICFKLSRLHGVMG